MSAAAGTSPASRAPETAHDRLRRALRGEAGETTPSLLVGLMIGSMVLMGFTMFWLAGRDATDTVVETTQRENAGLSVLNRITDQVSTANRVVKADTNEVVLEERRADGAGVVTVTRTRYTVDEDTQRLFTETESGPAADFTTSDTDWGADTDRKILAERLRPSSDPARPDYFSFVKRDGSAFVSGDDPADIKRIDVNYAALSGESDGYVELRTSAMVATGPTGEKDPIRPTCPVISFQQAHPFPRIAWVITGETDYFNVYRGGTLIARVDANSEQSDYSVEDTSRQGTTTPTQYVITAVGPGGESGVFPPSTTTVCAGEMWYPRIATPQVTTVLRAVAPEGPNWIGSGYNTAVVEMNWPQVTSPTAANYYQVYRRPLDPDTFQPLTPSDPPVQQGSNIPASAVGPGNEFTQTIPWDEAYEYFVVANGAMPEASAPSPRQPVLAHTTITQPSIAARPSAPGQNTVTWGGTPGPTATQWVIYRRDLSGCNLGVSSAWTRVHTASLATTSFVDTVPLSTRVEYMLAAYNRGPRGDRNQMSVQYASIPFTNQASALQFPADPRADARGSVTGAQFDRGNPANGPADDVTGYNRVIITPGTGGCAATTDRYRVDYFGADAPNNGLTGADYIGSREESVGNGTVTHQVTTRAPRASRRYYRAVAINATGMSANASTTSVTKCTSAGLNGSTAGCADPAYQYPNNPARPTASVQRFVDFTGWTRDVSPGGDVCQSRTYNDYYFDTRPLNTSTRGSWSYPRSSTGTYFVSYNYEWFYNPNAGPDVNPRDGRPDGEWQQRESSMNVAVVTRVGTEYNCERYRYSLFASYGNNVADNEAGGNRFCASDGGCRWRATFRVRSQRNGNTQDIAYTFTNSSNLSENRTFDSWQMFDPRWVIGPADTNITGATPGLRADEVCNPGGCLTTAFTPPTPPAADPLLEPVFQVFGSEGPTPAASGEENPTYVGRNTVAWAPVQGATSYQVLMYPDAAAEGDTRTPTAPQTVTVSGNACPAGVAAPYTLCWTDTTAARTGTGSKTFYKVVARNATQQTGQARAAAAAYQFPRETVVNFTLSQTPTEDDARATVTWNVRSGDAAETNAANQFCSQARDASDRCTYTLFAVDGAQRTEVAQIPSTAQSFTFVPTFGTSGNYVMRICNKGGCVERSVSIPTAAVQCDFSFAAGRSGITKETDTRRYQGDGTNGRTEVLGVQRFSWQRACGRRDEGVDHYRVGRVAPGMAQDPHQRTRPANFNPNNPMSGVRINPGEDLQVDWRATPGAVYRYYVWAVGDNGQVVPMTSDGGQAARMFMAPAPPLLFQSGRFCLPEDAQRGFKQATMWTGLTRSDQRDLAPVDRLRYYWWASGVPGQAWTAAPTPEVPYPIAGWAAEEARESRGNTSAETRGLDLDRWFQDNDGDGVAEMNENGPYYDYRDYGPEIDDSTTNADWNTGLNPVSGVARTIHTDGPRQTVPWLGSPAQPKVRPGFVMISRVVTVINPLSTNYEIGRPDWFRSTMFLGASRSYLDNSEPGNNVTQCSTRAGNTGRIDGWQLRSGNAYLGQWAGIQRNATPDSASRWDSDPRVENNFFLGPRY